jgi:hypothetical protein
MAARQRLPRKRKQPDQEYSLLAYVKSVTANYYISVHGEDAADEAITDLLAEIIMTTPRMHRQGNNCSLMCSRTYR